MIPLKDNNQGSIAVAYNSVFHSRTKHIDIQYHFLRDKVASKKIDLLYVLTNRMIANGLTKALTHVKFYNFIR